MKVAEKDSDRRAEVHICVDGQVNSLKEYGEYIDPRDKAICCYVGIDEGHRVKISGRFSGKTLIIAYDAIVDGTLRKSNCSRAKKVSVQKNKKLDVETFLFDTEKGIVDTQMHVAPVKNVSFVQGDAQETVGTLELRLYVTRRTDDAQSIGDVGTFHKLKNDNGNDGTSRGTFYKVIQPDLQMSFETNCAPLEKSKAKAEQRKIDAPRPGTKPWAIFRFHYRTKDAIAEQQMIATFDPDSKEKTDAHALIFDTVCDLIIGTEAHKDDDDASTRASSTPHDVPLTPVHGTHEGLLPPAKLILPSFENIGAVTVDASESPKTVTSEDKTNNQEPDTNESTTTVAVPAKVSIINSEAVKTSGTNDSTIVPDTTINNDSLSAATVTTTSKSIFVMPDIEKKTSDHKSVQETTSATKKDTIAKIIPKSNTLTNANSIKTPISNTNSTTKPINVLAKEGAVANKKRPAPLTNGKLLDTKRTKVDTTATESPAPPIMPRTGTPSGSPGSRTISIERQLAEQRKRMEELRNKRQLTAKKQEKLDEQLLPYKQRMAEELDRLNKELLEEEAALEDDEQQYNASVEMLKEFQAVRGDV